MLYDRNLFNVLRGLFPLTVALLGLTEVLSTRKEPEQCSGPVVELEEQGHGLDLSLINGGLFDAQEMRIVVGEVIYILLNYPPIRMVSPNVSRNLGVARTFISVDGLLDSSYELTGPDC